MPTEIEERVKELAAENAALKAEQIDMLLHPEKYFSIYRDIKTVFKRAERLEAENAALKAERDAAVKWMDEYRSKTYCAYCGATFDIDKDAFNVSEHIRTCPHHPMREVEAERDRLKTALLRIAAYGNDGICPYGCDTPDIARQALRGGED
jgi:hypothetical protein